LPAVAETEFVGNNEGTYNANVFGAGARERPEDTGLYNGKYSERGCMSSPRTPVGNATRLKACSTTRWKS